MSKPQSVQNMPVVSSYLIYAQTNRAAKLNCPVYNLPAGDTELLTAALASDNHNPLVAKWIKITGQPIHALLGHTSVAVPSHAIVDCWQRSWISARIISGVISTLLARSQMRSNAASELGWTIQMFLPCSKIFQNSPSGMVPLTISVTVSTLLPRVLASRWDSYVCFLPQ